MIYNPNAQESERKGRNIFKTLADQIGWQVDFTDAEFCDIDVHIKSTSKDGRNIQAAGEIKNRDASAIKYPTHIIEVHKIKALLADNKIQPCSLISLGMIYLYIMQQNQLR